VAHDYKARLELLQERLDLEEQKAEAAQLVNETFIAYEAHHEQALKKHTEAQNMNSEIAKAAGTAQSNLDHLPSSFDEVRGNIKRAKQLLVFITTSFELTVKVDAAVKNIEQMPNADGNLRWAIDGSKQAQTNYEGVESETQNLRKGVADKIALAETAIAKETEAIEKAEMALANFKKLEQTGNEQIRSLKNYADSIHLTVELLKHYKTTMDGFSTAVGELVDIDAADLWRQTNDTEFLRLKDSGKSLKDEHDQASTAPTTMTRNELKDKTTLENDRVKESENILNDASTTVTAAITAATEAGIVAVHRHQGFGSPSV
jgi:hypothetical protein